MVRYHTVGARVYVLAKVLASEGPAGSHRRRSAIGIGVLENSGRESANDVRLRVKLTNMIQTASRRH